MNWYNSQQGRGAIPKWWNSLDVAQREAALSGYFKTPMTRKKHAVKAYGQLPGGVRLYFNRRAAEMMRR